MRAAYNRFPLPGCAAPLYVSLRSLYNNKAWGPQAFRQKGNALYEFLKRAPSGPGTSITSISTYKREARTKKGDRGPPFSRRTMLAGLRAPLSSLRLSRSEPGGTRLIQPVVRSFDSLTQGSIEDAARDGPCAHGKNQASSVRKHGNWLG